MSVLGCAPFGLQRAVAAPRSNSVDVGRWWPSLLANVLKAKVVCSPRSAQQVASALLHLVSPTLPSSGRAYGTPLKANVGFFMPTARNLFVILRKLNMPSTVNSTCPICTASAESKLKNYERAVYFNCVKHHEFVVRTDVLQRLVGASEDIRRAFGVEALAPRTDASILMIENNAGSLQPALVDRTTWLR